MKLAVCLYKLFPFGGLARDCVRILSLCYAKGAQVDVFVMACEGEIPEGFNVKVIEPKGLSNHSKVASYIEQVKPLIAKGNYDLVIGFNKMPGLDLYYAADPCYIDRVKKQKNYPLIQFSGRVKFYSKKERAVFGKKSQTVALMISAIEKDKFKAHYNTPDSRLVMLPPGIDSDRRRAVDWLQKRRSFRQHLSLDNDINMLLMVGTGFKTKGVDRSIQALASLPEKLLSKTRLLIVGDGDSTANQKLADRLGVQNKIQFLGGRDEVPQFLLAADILVHPARKENTGTVILEALVAGLPSLVSGACGYAEHIKKSRAGLVSTEPFNQEAFNHQLRSMLDKDKLHEWSDKALLYADTEDLYSMPQKVAAIIQSMASEKSLNHDNSE